MYQRNFPWTYFSGKEMGLQLEPLVHLLMNHLHMGSSILVARSLASQEELQQQEVPKLRVVQLQDEAEPRQLLLVRVQALIRPSWNLEKRMLYQYPVWYPKVTSSRQRNQEVI
ncbi:hypothetical protein L798_03662 [Zootermopsis nevadensis]|uniref:Uncharacterized protein n=1 Tax=Zootermopsis nevadensis TaxID=136037 RepID=A0A067QFX7_ZOONE|nr:hypothetical protein L798_03662 [Zootermopsis nevadensis]